MFTDQKQAIEITQDPFSMMMRNDELRTKISEGLEGFRQELLQQFDTNPDVQGTVHSLATVSTLH